MKYFLTECGIRVENKEEFNPKHILECGQIFRFEINSKGNYVVYSLDKMAEIEECGDGYNIFTKDANYFINFFDLDTDYSSIKKEIIKKLPFMQEIIEKSQGLRILKQDVFEMIVSFIVSANNNIKRIKLILNRLCERCGEVLDGYRAFPTKEVFCSLSEEFFKEIGAGYRANYLADSKSLKLFLNKQDLSAMPTITLRQELLKIKGVGPKVADCILLFAFNKKDVFPVDVWMERVYYEFFSKETRNRVQISKYLVEKYGNLAGYIQQYLFYYKTIKN